MKTNVICMLFFVIVFTTVPSEAQNVSNSPTAINNSTQGADSIIVSAQSNDISNNLDLRAVASLFAEVKNLEEFEKKLNDYDSKISNLDLNKDGEIDYLRVVEKFENGIHLIVIQAVLSKDVYQDVATIVVDRKRGHRTSVQVIGDPYLYGSNYIIEPMYSYPPLIYSYLWSPYYRPWFSPFYWGYYPPYFRVRHPFTVFGYLSYIHPFINHYHHYYYADGLRVGNYRALVAGISRSDYSRVHPQLNFASRIPAAVNKQSFSSYQYYPGTRHLHQLQIRVGGRRGYYGGRSASGHRR
jgi:hypothetical protein